MAFEMDFESEILLSAIKSMICRRFSLFRFRFWGFVVVLSGSSAFIEANGSKFARNTFPLAKSTCVFPILFLFYSCFVYLCHCLARVGRNTVVVR